jgi:ParB/RepB/Spo0J family partition protein
MTTFDTTMQNALREDAQKLRDQSVDVADPMFGDDVDLENPPITDVEASAPAVSARACAECSYLQGHAAWCTQRADAPARATQPYESVDSAIFEIALDDIAPDPAQARDEGADDSIGDTLKPTDILPPIELRAHPHAGEMMTVINKVYPPYMIIDGERRWRGSKKAGRTTIRAWVNPNPGDDGDRLLRQAVLNEGERLKPMEEARTWARIRAAKGWNIQQLAEAVKRPKSTVSDRLAMLEAPAVFQPLFADGTLSAAAAPVIRPYVHLSESILTKMLQRAMQSYEWTQATRGGKTVAIKVVEEALAATLSYPFNLMDAKRDADYEGETFEVKGKRYAVDNDAYWKYVRERQSKETKSSGSSTTTSASSQDWQRKQAAEQKRWAEKREREVKARLLHVAAVNAKLPSELSAPWLLLLIDHVLLTEGNSAEAAELIGLPKPSKSKNGMASHKQLRAHAEKLDAKGRAKLLLQLMLAESANQYGGREFLDAAAKILMIDLKKIKPPADEKAKKAPAKPVSKKRR